jgi:hypothetical protein
MTRDRLVRAAARDYGLPAEIWETTDKMTFASAAPAC